MVKYKTIFFDLDHTIWDYDTNSKEVLNEIYDRHIAPSGTSLTKFLKDFERINERLWDQYNKGEIDKDIIRNERFVKILAAADIDDHALAESISEFYLFECPRRTHLIPGAIEVLDYVKERYDLHILTNGFNDVQDIKVAQSGIRDYFKHIITSESTGYKKPSPEFFEYAFAITKCSAQESLMVGDNLKTDIAGAHKVNMDSVYFNPSAYAKPNKANYEITTLQELLKIL